MRLLAVGAELKASAAATRDTADALATAARRVDQHAAEGGAAAGHAHVRDGLADLADYHAGYVRLLSVAVQALADEMTEFDACMAGVDRDLATGR